MKGALPCPLLLVEGEGRPAELEGPPRTQWSWGPSRTLMATSSSLGGVPGGSPKTRWVGRGRWMTCIHRTARGEGAAASPLGGRQGQK